MVNGPANRANLPIRAEFDSIPSLNLSVKIENLKDARCFQRKGIWIIKAAAAPRTTPKAVLPTSQAIGARNNTRTKVTL
jgi:hypothetical protein